MSKGWLCLTAVWALGCNGLIQTSTEGGEAQSSTGGESPAYASGVTASGPQGGDAQGGDAQADPSVAGTGGQPSAAPAPTGPGGTGDQAQDAQTLNGAAQLIRALGNRSEWTLSDTTSARAGQNAQMMTKKLEKQQEAERVAAQVQPVHAAFKARYLSRLRPDQDAGNELRNTFGDNGMQVSNDWLSIERGLREIAETAPFNARRCVEVLRQIGTERQYLAALNEMFRARSVADARSLLDICPRFQPNDAQVQATMTQLRPQVEALLTEYHEAELAAARERNWESNANVSAGSAAQLAGNGLQFLRSHPNWGGERERGTTVLGVVVRGDWFVAERNFLGQPTKWGLPVHVAIRNNETAEGIARVYELSLVTSSSNKAPPFGAYWVGNVWQILADRVR